MYEEEFESPEGRRYKIRVVIEQGVSVTVYHAWLRRDGAPDRRCGSSVTAGWKCIVRGGYLTTVEYETDPEGVRLRLFKCGYIRQFAASVVATVLEAVRRQ